MSRPLGERLFLPALLILVALVVGIGLWVVGSPGTRRLERLDLKRVTELKKISWAVNRYWKEENHLPDSLAELTRWEEREEPREDPSTHQPFRYTKTGEREYQLCATFELAGEGQDRRYHYDNEPSSWRHPAGDHCFDLEVEDDD